MEIKINGQKQLIGRPVNADTIKMIEKFLDKQKDFEFLTVGEIIKKYDITIKESYFRDILRKNLPGNSLLYNRKAIFGSKKSVKKMLELNNEN